MTFFAEAFADHLSLDAVVAFADGELTLGAYQRAAAHIAQCQACAAEVAEQTSARDLLRSAYTPQMPGSLFDQLRSIPVALPINQPISPSPQQPGSQSIPPDSVFDTPRRLRFGRR